MAEMPGVRPRREECPVRLIVLYGLPGVGKLTVARELSRLTGFRLFHNHLTVDLITSLFDFGTPPFRELREEIWLSLMARAAAERVAGLIFTFVFEQTMRDDFIPSLRAAVEKHGGAVRLVELVCSQAALASRVEDPERARYGKIRSRALLEQLLAAHALRTPSWVRPDFRLDTTDLSAAEAARQIQAALGAE
jgi:chloramphenicol 3-O-phosphotransferase